MRQRFFRVNNAGAWGQAEWKILFANDLDRRLFLHWLDGQDFSRIGQFFIELHFVIDKKRRFSVADGGFGGCGDVGIFYGMSEFFTE